MMKSVLITYFQVIIALNSEVITSFYEASSHRPSSKLFKVNVQLCTCRMWNYGSVATHFLVSTSTRYKLDELASNDDEN